MARSKKVNDEKLTAMFKALSNPNRLDVFLYLASFYRSGVLENEQQRISVGLIASNLSVVPSTASHHVKQLHQAGLIQMKRRGQKIECWINSENLNFMKKFFAEMNEKLINNYKEY